MTETTEWFSAKDLVGAVGVPASESGINRRAKRDTWRWRKRNGKGGGREYHLSSLPVETRQHLSLQDVKETKNALPAEPKPAPDKVAQLAAFNRLSQHKQERARARFRVLCTWWEWLRNSNQPKRAGAQLFCLELMAGRLTLPAGIAAHLPQRNGAVSLDYSTLTRWENRERELGLMGLADHYGNRKNQSKINRNPELRKLIVGLIIDKPHTRAGVIRDYLRAQRPDLDLVGARSIERFINHWRDEHGWEYDALTDPDRWKNRRMAAFGSRSEGIVRLSQLWEMDATPADWMLIDGRHSVSGVIDVHSRRAKLLVTKTPKSAAHCSLLRRAILSWGMPERLKLDNGQDYLAERLARVCRDLDIEQDFCQPFTPEDKPHIERFFRTLSHGILDHMTGFIGHSVADRKQIEARASFAKRLMTKGEVIEVSLSAEQLQSRIDDWVEHYYEREPHGGLDGRTPWTVANAYQGSVHIIDNERALDMLLADGGTREVGKKGVAIDNGRYIHPTLADWIGETVEVLRDPEELAFVYVYGHPPEASEKVFICRAEDPDRSGISRQEVALAAKQRQTTKRKVAAEAARDAKKSIKGVDIVTAVLEHRKQQHANVTQLPRRGEAFTTPALDAAADAAHAREASPHSQLTAEQLDARDRLTEEMSAPATVTTLGESTEARMRRWMKLNARIKGGETLQEPENRFWGGFQETPEWRTQMMMLEDFGADYDMGFAD